jgi:DNA polymerase I-like protein with 3'-5' exonuclease and polymerase domains
MIAVDTETTGLMFHDEAFMASTAYRAEGEILSDAWDLPDPDLAPILEAQKPWVFHNAKFDLQKLLLAGIIKREQVSIDSFHDTQSLAYLLDEHQEVGLKALARNLLGIETDELTKMKEEKERIKKEKGLRSIYDVSYDMIPREIIAPYAVKDAEYTLLLYEHLYPLLPPDMYRLYDMERELILVLLDVENNGVAVDVSYLEEKEEEYRKRAFHLEIKAREITGMDEFNPNSGPQIIAAFDAVGIELPNTRKTTLAKLDHELAQTITELRGVRKLHGTYLKGLLAEQRDGLVHPQFNMSKTKTRRLSSSGSSDD